MTTRTKVGAAMMAATMAVALPATASAGPGGRGGERGGDRNVPSRVATKLRAADRALDRAQQRVEDGESAAAVTSLTSVRTNLASALTAAKRRIVAGNEAGAPSAKALSRTDHKVIADTTALFDGADGTVTDATALTLKAALDNRDALVASIAALDADNTAGYARVLARIVDQTADEIEQINEALSDDTLTDAAKTSLNSALTQLAATATAAQAQIPAASAAEDAGYGTAGEYDENGRDCPPRGERGAGYGSGGGYGSEDPSGSYPQT